MARAYDDDPDTVTRLARKSIDGGSGQWGLVPMTAHPDLSVDQAEQMVRYILALTDYQGAETESPDAETAVDQQLLKAIPGDQREVAGLHPSFDLFQARPHDFEPMVGGIDFMPDRRMVVTTWDPEGSVYLVENYTAEPQDIKVKRIARGLAETLGVEVVSGGLQRT